MEPKLLWITANADKFLCDLARSFHLDDEVSAEKLLASALEHEFGFLETISACFELDQAAYTRQQYSRFLLPTCYVPTKSLAAPRLIFNHTILTWVEWTKELLACPTTSFDYKLASSINKTLGEKLPLLWTALTMVKK